MVDNKSELADLAAARRLYEERQRKTAAGLARDQARARVDMTMRRRLFVSQKGETINYGDFSP